MSKIYSVRASDISNEYPELDSFVTMLQNEDENVEICEMDIDTVKIYDIILRYAEKEFDLRKGDIIHIKEKGEYRNCGKLIFDGCKLLSLDTSIDEYGNLPSCFFVGDEFLSDHWTGTIHHNGVIWVDLDKYRQQLLNNLNEDGSFFISDSNQKFSVFFDAPEIKHKKHHACFINLLQNNNLFYFYSYPWRNVDSSDPRINPYSIWFSAHNQQSQHNQQ